MISYIITSFFFVTSKFIPEDGKNFIYNSQTARIRAIWLLNAHPVSIFLDEQFPMSVSDRSQNLDWLYRGTSEIFPDRSDSDEPQENLALFLSKVDRPVRVKLGIDPTGSEIHLGHSIPFRKLRAFQDAGHTAVVIIGDFTATIGDPTGKSEVRRQLTSEQVRDNAKDYLDRLRPILDFDTPGRLEIRYNSEWLAKLDLKEILELLSTMTVGQMLAKEGFAERYTQENPIFLHEFLYPLMQGYDSVAVNADVELGGTDQKFNIAVGRDLQRHFGKKPQFGLLLPILLGTDGVQKMSKSLNNYVGLSEDALSMYSKLEKTPDALIKNYFELLTNLPLDKLPENPRECQKLLAVEVVSKIHGSQAAIAAQKTAEDIVMKGSTASAQAVPEYSLAQIEFPAKLYYILNASGLCSSNGDARRQIQGGAVRLDGDRISDSEQAFESPDQLNGKVLQVGKKKFVRLTS
ncbi:MAG: tyrosine--tRNA ligase [Hydrococcus sp. Prado102]|nr:tyrosine--tRNA ligase [Hydrococcus sp. Prado102]